MVLHLTRQNDDPVDRILWIGTVVLLASVIFSTFAMHLTAVVLTLSWVVGMIVRKRWIIRRTPFDLPILAFVAARLLAILFSIDPVTSLDALRTEIFFYPLFFIFAGTIDLTRPDELRFLLRVIAATAVLAAVIGTTKYLTGMEQRAASTTAGYYTLGLYLCVVLPVMMSGERQIFARRWIWAVSCAIVMIGIVFTFNRLHWAGMALAVLVVGAVWERRLLLVSLAGAAVLAVLSPVVAGRLMEAVAFTSNSSGRDVLWRGAFMIAGRHPLFGFGLRTFPLVFPLRSELADQGVGSWHNDYLQIYMDSGLAGLLTFLFFVATVYVVAYKRYRAGTIPADSRRLFGGLLVSCTVVFIAGGALDTHVSVLFRFLLALLGLLMSADQRPRISRETPGT